jgi:Na+/H+ antiporter
MTFFESLLALLFAAILLLQVSRRLSLPYPAMLAAAGVLVALVPGAPTITIDPATALALFIAPALLDAAFDFPVGSVKKLWRPLFALAVVAVLLSAAVVAWIGWAWAGLPFAAALALGAIVAPPDAAAATAVLSSVSLPRQTTAVLKGESLLNDATALLLFGVAMSIQSHGGIDIGIATHLAIAAPGGVLLGVAIAWIYAPLIRYVSGTLGGNLLEFVNTFLVWIIADRLGLSAVLCVVAFAMTIARSASFRQAARVRVHSFAVWTSVVFLFNVLAFLLMGLQAKTIVAGMSAQRLQEAAAFAGIVILALVIVRLVWVLTYNRLAFYVPLFRGAGKPASIRQGLLVGWAGMRGFVTLATAFSLPADFPQRDLLVLTAFAVVLATLIVQGVTLGPLIKLLKLDQDGSEAADSAVAHRDLAEAALKVLAGKPGIEADHLRHLQEIKRDASAAAPKVDALEERRTLGLAVIKVQRKRLEGLRDDHTIGADVYEVLQEELDFQEITLTSGDQRRIEES